MFENISLLLWIVGPAAGLFGMFAGGYWGVGCEGGGGEHAPRC